MRRAAAIVLGATAFAGVAAGVYVARGEAPPTAASPAPAWCSPGQDRQWELSFGVSVTPPGARDPVRVAIEGEWHSIASEVRGEECDVAHQLTNARAVGEGVGQVSAAELAAWQRRLQRRFWVTYRRDGAALRAHFPRELEPSDRNLLQMIATGLQVVQPRQVTDHWTALERDAAGMYLADYRRTGPQQLAKRKLTYTVIDAASGARAPDGVTVEIVASAQTVSFDSALGVSELEGTEQLRLGVPFGQNSWLETRTTIQLRNLHLARADSAIASLERARPTVDSSAIRTHNPDPEPARAQRDAELLDGRTTEALLAATQSRGDDRELPERLAALFRRRPDALPAALAFARTRPDARRITEALAAAGTPLALTTLATLAHDRAATEGARVDALNALALVEAPPLETMRSPGDLLDEPSTLVRRAALLSSGALARAGRRDHPQEAEAIDRTLVARYAAATDEAGRLELLSAFGNSAGPLLLPVIDAALRSDRPDLRAAAASALRLVEAPEADTWLARAMTTDAEARVRAAGLFAASFRPLGPLFDAIESVATKDQVEALRRDADALLRRAQRRPISRANRSTP